MIAVRGITGQVGFTLRVEAVSLLLQHTPFRTLVLDKTSTSDVKNATLSVLHRETCNSTLTLFFLVGSLC